MSVIYNFFAGIGRLVPAVLEKVGAVLLLAFGLGAIFGYFIGFNDKTWLWLFIPFISMIVMWYELDEGTLIFILLMLFAFFL